MRWLIFGGRGMLGTDMVDVLHERGEDPVGIGSGECEIRNLTAVERAIEGFDVVVNAAAWTAVDDAEMEESSAFDINCLGARNVALSCARSGARMVQVSTDYVFDGFSSVPYKVDDPQNPLSSYGRTKAAGEWAVSQVNSNALIVRTGWLYGNFGNSFLKAMLNLSKDRPVLRVVDDQVGQPTWTVDLADFIATLVTQNYPGGFYHGTNSGSVSRYGLVRELFRQMALDPERIHPCSSTEYPRPAVRPAYSVLEHPASAPGLPQWETALGHYANHLRSLGWGQD